MNLKSIEYFLIIADERNISRAADRISISQQALSAQIKRMEEELGAPLFERKPLFRLTPSGEQLVYYGRQMMNTNSNLQAALSDISTEKRGKLRVGISRLRSDAFFPLIWKLYHPSHTNIDIELVNGNSSQLDAALESGRIDLYVGVDVPNNYNRHKIQIGTEKIMCGFEEAALRKCYPDTWRELLKVFSRHGVDPNQISRMPLLSMRTGNKLRHVLDEYVSQNTKLHYILESEQQNIIYDMMRQGNGAGIVSPVICYKHHLDPDFSTPTFHLFPLVDKIPTTTTYLVYSNEYRIPVYMSDFIQDATMVFTSFTRAMNRNFV
ncbi:MAG: LysR family transcriptional regulator [Stomatobaculum sp.]